MKINGISNGFWRGYTNGVVQTVSKQHASILCEKALRAVGAKQGFYLFPCVPPLLIPTEVKQW